MKKNIVIAVLVALVGAIMGARVVLAQSPTPEASPSPSPTPAGAPQTGYGTLAN